MTPTLLDLLARWEAKATFFVLTDKAAAHPDLIQRMLREGHEVGLHFDRHDRITSLPADVARARLKAAKAQLEAIAGPITYFRPPYGGQSLRTYFMARALGLQVVTWWGRRRKTDRAAAGRRCGARPRDDVGRRHPAASSTQSRSKGDTIAPTFDRIEMVELILNGMS